MIKFKQSQFSGDVNWLEYGGIWVANESGDHWYIREIYNNEDVGVFSPDKYTVILAELYVDSICEETLFNVKNYTGFGDDVEWDDLKEWQKVVAYYQYGCSDKIKTISGNNYKKLFKEIRQHT